MVNISNAVEVVVQVFKKISLMRKKRIFLTRRGYCDYDNYKIGVSRFGRSQREAERLYEVLYELIIY
jgi:hypothetical protein